MCDKNAKESWEIIDELAFDDNELWEVAHVVESAVNAISLSIGTTQLSEENLCELEKKVDYLMEKRKKSLSPKHASINSISNVNPTPLSVSPLRENAETFQKYAQPYSPPQNLSSEFETRMREYMTTHSE